MKNVKSIFRGISSYVILAYSLVAACFLTRIEEYNFFFLSLLFLGVWVAVLNRSHYVKPVVHIVRTLLGMVFIFSGFVKGVDPLGTQYVIHDYLEAYHLPWLMSLDLLGSFLLNALEFTIGVLLVLNVRLRIVLPIAAVMMLGFTLTTLYDAVANPVPDCGCFGKAVILTNWQTFYKNIILDIWVLIGLYTMKKVERRWPAGWEWGSLGTVVVLFLCFEVYNVRHLPCINFLEWKVGHRLFPENPLPVKYFVSYENQINGQVKEFLLEDVPYDDTAFVKEWKYVSRRDEDPNDKTVNIGIVERTAGSEEEYDVTDVILKDRHYNFLICVYDLDKMNEKGWEKVRRLIREADEAGWLCNLLTASSPEKVEEFKRKYPEDNLNFYYADDTGIKAIVRSNPGVLLLKDAWILGAWAWRDLPEMEQILSEYGQDGEKLK